MWSGTLPSSSGAWGNSSSRAGSGRAGWAAVSCPSSAWVWGVLVVAGGELAGEAFADGGRRGVGVAGELPDLGGDAVHRGFGAAGFRLEFGDPGAGEGVLLGLGSGDAGRRGRRSGRRPGAARRGHAAGGGPARRRNDGAAGLAGVAEDQASPVPSAGRHGSCRPGRNEALLRSSHPVAGSGRKRSLPFPYEAIGGGRHRPGWAGGGACRAGTALAALAGVPPGRTAPLRGERGAVRWQG